MLNKAVHERDDYVRMGIVQQILNEWVLEILNHDIN